MYLAHADVNCDFCSIPQPVLTVPSSFCGKAVCLHWKRLVHYFIVINHDDSCLANQTTLWVSGSHKKFQEFTLKKEN